MWWPHHLLSLHFLRYVADGHRKRYHSALRSLEVVVDRIAIITTALADSGLRMCDVSRDTHNKRHILLA